MTNLTFLLTILAAFAIQTALAAPTDSQREEKVRAGARGDAEFMFVDATNPAEWKQRHRVELEKVRFVGKDDKEECPTMIWHTKERAKTMAKFELATDRWENEMTQEEFEQMSIEIAYKDLQGERQKVTVKIDEIQSEEVRKDLYKGGRIFRMEMMPDGSANVSINWASDPSALNVIIVEENNAAHSKLRVERVSVAQSNWIPCKTGPIKEGQNGPEFHLDWMHCNYPGYPKDPEELRGFEIRVEYSLEHNQQGGKKQEAVIVLEKYPSAELEKLYYGHYAKITVSGQSEHAKIEHFVPKPAEESKPACAFNAHYAWGGKC